MKKVISAVAAMTLLSSSAFAFESLVTGEIVTSKVQGIKGQWIPQDKGTNLVYSDRTAMPDHGLTATTNTLANATKYLVTKEGDKNYIQSKYKDGFGASAALVQSSNSKGDALIFPAFTQKPGFESEFVIRNLATGTASKKEAIIAKVVFYSADTSREVVDFNIYLSPNDVFRFKIKDKKLTTTDDSVVKSIDLPYATTAKPKYRADKVTMNKDGEEFLINQDINGKLIPVDEETGYVVVYAMAQAENSDLNNYDHKHADLVKDYRLTLDYLRPTWRNAYNDNNFQNGMMKIEAKAPNTHTFFFDASNANYQPVSGTEVTKDFKFKDPSEGALVGTVKVIRTTDSRETDMILPAKALRNYTDNSITAPTNDATGLITNTLAAGDGQLMLWTEGEYASIADRRIIPTSVVASGTKFKFGTALPTAATGWNKSSRYNVEGVFEDTKDFVIKSGIYTFEKETKNAINFTQPFKRIIAQLGDAYLDGGSVKSYYTKVNDWNYRGFTTTTTIYDEAENAHKQAGKVATITSPYNSSTSQPDSFKLEFQTLTDEKDLQNADAVKTTFEGKNGFGYINIENANGIPAIATQFLGSTVNGKSATNWIYSPFTK